MARFHGAEEVDAVRWRASDGEAAAFGLREVARTRVDPPVDGVCRVSEGVDGVLTVVVTFGFAGVLGEPAVVADFVDVDRSDFVDAAGRSVGAALADPRRSGVLLVARAAATDALLASDVRLAEGVTVGVFAARAAAVADLGMGGTAGAEPGVTLGARAFVLDADIVRVRGARPPFIVVAVLAADPVRDRAVADFAPVVVGVVVAAAFVPAAVAVAVAARAAGLAVVAVPCFAAYAAALVAAAILAAAVLCAGLVGDVDPDLTAVADALPAAVAVAVLVAPIAVRADELERAVAVEADVREVATELTDASDIWWRRPRVGLAGRWAREPGRDAGEGDVTDDSPTARLAAALDPLALPPVKSGRGGPVMTCPARAGVGLCTLCPAGVVRPLAPTDTTNVLCAAVGLRGCGPLAGGARRCAEAVRDAEAAVRTDTAELVDAELDKRRVRRPLGSMFSGVWTAAERMVDVRLESDVVRVRVEVPASLRPAAREDVRGNPLSRARGKGT